MLFGKYDFTCCFETEAQLPYYKGSTFRGVFGRALKKVVCALKHQECDSCILNTQCVYAQVFETLTSHDKKQPSPHPFVIEPPLTDKTHFPAGSYFNFSLLLMGRVNNSIAYFIYALEQMGRIGIGRQINGKRGRFLLESVYKGKHEIYSYTDRKLVIKKNTESLNLAKLQNYDNNGSNANNGSNSSNGINNISNNNNSNGSKNNSNSNNNSNNNNGSNAGNSGSSNTSKSIFSLKLTLETPLRLKYDNRLQADLPFHVLVRATLRRISSLMNAFSHGEPDLDYSGLVKKAFDVKISDNNLSWYDWQRYSFRQDKKMLMGGITGNITYKGHLAEYIPLVKFCEQVHLGKQTSFGLGKIKAKIIT